MSWRCCKRRHETSDFQGIGHDFHLEGARNNYLPNFGFAIEAIDIDITPDFENESFSAKTKLTCQVTQAGGLSRFVFHQIELMIQQVTLKHGDASTTVPFVVDDTEVTVITDEYAMGSTVDIEFEYFSKPRWGLVFMLPNDSDPLKAKQLWSLNQDEYAKCWFPCHDTPQARSKFAITVRSPKEMLAISNGVCTLDTTENDLRVMRYESEQLLAPYLMTLCVGQFVVHEIENSSLPIRYITSADCLDDTIACLAKTPQMIDFLEDFTQMKFQFPKYDQVVVYDYSFGGMEHSGATTLTHRTLRNTRALLDSNSESLVVHELAHQWFGDVVTCREWSDGWLNEGFATYVEHLWIEQSRGFEEAQSALFDNLQSYLSETKQRYSRAVVDRLVHAPIDLFDSHLYEKGGAILHAMRGQIGFAAFKTAVQNYLVKNKFKNVTTTDLKREFEASSSSHLDRFFDQFVFNAGHAELTIQASWSADNSTLSLEIEQTQDPKRFLESYELSLDLVIGSESPQVTKIHLDKRRQTLSFKCENDPRFVAIDGDGYLLGSLECKFPARWMRAQVLESKQVVARIRAARHLAKTPSLGNIQALEQALKFDPFWRIRAEAARALGIIRCSASTNSLLTALENEKHLKARRAIVRALAKFKGPEVLESLKRGLLSARSVFVEAQSVTSLAEIAGPELKDTLTQIFHTNDSWHDTVRAAALKGLLKVQDHSLCYQKCLESLSPERDLNLRITAINVLTSLAEICDHGLKTQIVQTLIDQLQFKNFRLVLTTIKALGKLASAAASSPLQREYDHAIDGRIKRACRQALRKISSSSESSADLSKIAQRLDNSEAEVRALKLKIEALESK